MNDDEEPEDTPADDPRIGQVVAGRYRLNARIGRGGMGAIYEVQHSVTGKRFAMKTLLPGLGGVSEIVKRFEREARAVSVLSHPNIVSVVDFGSHEGSLYLVMELVNGRSLGEVMETEGLTTLRALHVARQVLEALAHAHAQGVVHRDLKPDNIMLVDAGESDEERDIVKLLDFGIAKLVGDAQGDPAAEKLTQAGVAFGTPDYMAPEQALGEEVDARADLYALGCIVHELLTGAPPFDSVDKLAVLRMHVAVSAPPIEESYSPELRALVARALQKRRQDRYADATEMLAALDVAIVAEAGPPADLATSPADDADQLTLPPLADRVLTVEPAAPEAQPEALVTGRLGTEPLPPRAGGGLVDTLFARVRAASGKRIGMAFGALALVVFVVVVASRDEPRSTHSLGPAPPAPAAEQAAEVAAAGWRAAGFAFAAAGRDDDAVAAHWRALSAVPKADPMILQWAGDLLAKKNANAGVVSLLPLLGKDGRAMLVDQASRGRTVAVRARARDLAAEQGLSAEVDLVSSFSLDLAQASTCRDRREVVPRLRALADKRAIPALKKARNRSGGFLGLSEVNGCLDRDAAEAIEFLQALP